MHIFLFQVLIPPSWKYIPHLSSGLFATLKAELSLNQAIILKKRGKANPVILLHRQTYPPPPFTHTHCSRLRAKKSFWGQIQKTWKDQGSASLKTASDCKTIPFSDYLPGSSMWIMIQLKATSAPIFPVKYTAFRHASRGKPISASCITDDSSMSEATEHNRTFWGQKVNSLPVLASLHPFTHLLSKESAILLGIQMVV